MMLGMIACVAKHLLQLVAAFSHAGFHPEKFEQTLSDSRIVRRFRKLLLAKMEKEDHTSALIACVTDERAICQE